VDIYPYPPFRAIYKTIAIYLLFAAWIVLLALYKEDSILLGLVGFQCCLQLAGDIRSYWQRKRRWLAKTDEEFLYLYTPKNKFPKRAIGDVERQIICGRKHGINIVYRNGHVHSEQFQLLNEPQIEELMQFLKRSIATI